VNLEDLKGLVAHMQWADAQVWAAALSNAEKAEEDRALRAKLSHAHGVQRAFLCVWQGVRVVRPPAEPPDLKITLAAARVYYEDLARFLDALDEVLRGVPRPRAHRDDARRDVDAGRHAQHLSPRAGQHEAARARARARADRLHRLALVREARPELARRMKGRG
jgi:hypothetical protein